MYSGNHNHHYGGGLRMYLQRFLCSYRIFVAIFIVFLFTIFLYYYNESLTLLKAREVEGNQCQQKLDSVAAQLQVVYEHKSRLEKALTADKDACSKRVDEISKTLKKANDGLEKSKADLKALQKQHDLLKKQVTDLKTEKEASEKAVSKAGVDAAKVKDQYAKEVESYKGENVKLNVIVVQLQTALNKSVDQVRLLQQQLDQQRQQLAYLQQHQQSQPGPQAHQPYNAAAVREPVQVPNQSQYAVRSVTQQSILAPMLANGSIQIPPPGGQVPPENVAFAVRPQTVAVQPQPEQVAVPMAEHRQQQLLAQRQVPLQQQQQDRGQPAAPAPVLQHPLGEDQQQLLMVRQNVANAAAAPGVRPVVQTPPAAPFPAPGQPLQQQAPPPAPAAAVHPVDNQKLAPPPAAAQDGDVGAGVGAAYHDIEPLGRHFDQNAKAADEYKDDEEENRLKDFDNER